MTERDRRIRDIAYQLWEEAGRPEGQDDAHWREAERRVDAQEGSPSVKPGKTGAAKASKTKAGAAAADANKAAASVGGGKADPKLQPKASKNPGPEETPAISAPAGAAGGRSAKGKSPADEQRGQGEDKRADRKKARS